MSNDSTRFPDAAAHFLLEGAAGSIEVASDRPAQSPRLGTALICHPHPLHGGSMQNKVVTTTERALRELGLSTLRFNFRGVGQSQGSYDEGRGEGEDLLLLAQWVRAARPRDVLWLAGFSFGAFVSITRAAAIAPAQLISLAPPVGRWQFEAIAYPQCPWLVIQPEADEVVDAAAVFVWAEQLTPRVELVRFPNASHFFHGQLTTLREAIQTRSRAPLPPLEQ
ncbi:MAG: alpha/beta hydrolase [Pseudomonadota bacterium]|nr:alpha/beta hydrolase [Pseudomonadota bacterium]